MLSIESYIAKGLISRGLHEHVIPAEHLHNESFLTKWKQKCIVHGESIMKRIVGEEKLRLRSYNHKLRLVCNNLNPSRINQNLKNKTKFKKKKLLKYKKKNLKR